MNNCITFERKLPQSNVKPNNQYQYHVGTISIYNRETEVCLIDGHISAEVADGLLVAPHTGDLVAYLINENDAFLLQILRQTVDSTQIHCHKPLSIHAPKVNISANQKLDMVGLEGFSLVGKQGVISVAGSLVTCAEHLVQQVNQFMLNAKGMLRLSGRQQVMTAEEDIRIDGKRINMG